jgi:hypothetical protein
MWLVRIALAVGFLVLAASMVLSLQVHWNGLPEGWFLTGSIATAACVLLFPSVYHGMAFSSGHQPGDASAAGAAIEDQSSPNASSGRYEPPEEGRRRRWWFAGILVTALVLQIDFGQVSRAVFRDWTETGRTGSWFNLPRSHAFRDFCVPRDAPHTSEAQASSTLADATPTHLELVRLEYDTAVAEIRQRVDQEQALFYLKFGVVAAVMLAVFKLLHDRMLHDKNIGIHEILGDWRIGNAFLWAAVLGSAIVDARLRYNSKMIETLGCWIYLVESHAKGAPLLWETYLRAGNVFFEMPTYGLLRSFPSFLTILLFVGTVYYSLVKPAEPQRIARFCACGTIISLACTCISYHGESPVWLLHCILWAAVGTTAVLQTSGSKRQKDSLVLD